jgi:SAM-dependent methyltransferase
LKGFILMREQDFVAGQDFLLAVKKQWTTQMYPALKDKYADAGPEDDVATIAAHMNTNTDYRLFAWFERHLQKMKYSGSYGLAPYHRERQDALVDALLEPLTPDALQLDEQFEQPAYYTSVDIHQHPGGVWSEPVSGLIYERGARTTTPLLNKSHRDLHDRFTDSVLGDERLTTEAPDILDLGCGFGKSTRPFWTASPGSHITAVDLAAPCLRVAASEAARDSRDNMVFRQADARHTGCADESVDLLTSTMLLHEMPDTARREMFAESWRVLRPGGIAVHLDFWLLPTPFDRFIMEGHSKRNNEPFMKALFDSDLPGDLRETGFVDIDIAAFSEADGIDPLSAPFWRFPWTRIAMMKPK